MKTIVTLTYLLSSVLFILGLKYLSSPKTARQGNILATVSMFIAIVITLLDKRILNFSLIITGMLIGSTIGVVLAKKAKMTIMPQIVALLNGIGGGASALVSLAEYYHTTGELHIGIIISILFGLFIGILAFTGSLVAYGKLQGVIKTTPVVFRMQQVFNLLLFISCLMLGVIFAFNPANQITLLAIILITALLGILFVIPIGGADMPIVISLLNSCSGLAAAATGFVIFNEILIVCGALVGASGIILTLIMCEAMNRSLKNVFFGAVGSNTSRSIEGIENRIITRYTPEDAAMVLEGAQSVIIIPGYGLAVARAQYVLHDLAKTLMSNGTWVRYAIHPVAGRMPGHMNVLLAEANVPYDLLFDLDTINDDFQNTDVVLIVGANDVTNPAARTQKDTPLYGMPILNADKAKTLIICKRSLSPGFSGMDNELFYNSKTMMILGDARESITEMLQLVKV
jgi:H+-translocating NAD(P) transhydrogenase subunit beta